MTVNYMNKFLVFGVEPDFTREGGSIPVTLTFQAISIYSRLE
jgi:hypothetical protein